MSEKLREALSAAVDGEASEFELRRVFDELAKDDGLQKAWSSYHLIKQAAHGENVQDVEAMRERIWASIDAEQFLEEDIVQEEPLVESAGAPPKRGFQIAGGAIAAALALGVFLSGGFLDNSEPSNSTANTLAVTETNPSSQVSPDPLLQNSGTEMPVYEMPAPTVADAGRLQTVEFRNPDSTNQSGATEDYDYGRGFIPYDELSAADKARSDGYFMHHVQHQAVNNDNVLSFVKMISYPQ